MERSAWDRLVIHWSATYFIELIVIIVAVCVLFITRKRNKEKLYYLFVIYSLMCIVLFSLTEIGRVFFHLSGKASIMFVESLNSVFTLIELCVFIIYFFHIIESATSKKVLSFLFGFFAIAFIVFMIKLFEINSELSEISKSSVIVNIVEFCILLITIFLYFIQLFTKPPTLNLANSPAFWIASGLFIYILVSLPMLLFNEHLKIEKDLYHLLFVLHYISLLLLLLTISKAFLCRQPLTT
jgi:hypothetical protein